MEYIQRLPDLNGCPAFVYSCYGGCVANNVPYTLAKELTAKGAIAIGGAQLLTPHSCRIGNGKRLGDVEGIFGKGLPDEGMLDEFKGSIRLDENKTATINQKTCYRCYGCMEVCPNEALSTNWKQAELLVRSMNWFAKDTEKFVFVL